LATQAVNITAASEMRWKRWQQRWPQLPALIGVSLALITAVGLCYSLTLQARQEWQSSLQEHQRISQEVQRLQRDNQKLLEKLESVEKDSQMIETLAREAGMVAGEDSVLLLKPRSQSLPRSLSKTSLSRQ
jgi:hypothetical protein